MGCYVNASERLDVVKMINGNGEKIDEATISLVEAYLDGELEVFGQNWEEIPFAMKERGKLLTNSKSSNMSTGYQKSPHFSGD